MSDRILLGPVMKHHCQKSLESHQKVNSATSSVAVINNSEMKHVKTISSAYIRFLHILQRRPGTCLLIVELRFLHCVRPALKYLT